MIETKAPFTPTAVLITADAEFKDGDRTAVDPTLVTLLHLESDDNSGDLFTKEEWEQGAEPRIFRHYSGDYAGLAEGERVELLPDMWIVKIDEREHWRDPVILAQTSRLFGVYVFDRRQVTHCCELSGSYCLTFLGTQWQPLSDLTDQQCEDLADAIREGDCQCDSTNYFSVAAVERMIAQPCRKHFLPEGTAGGFHVEVTAVVTDDAVAEIEEAYRQCEL